jgi:beta-phosphoglucomutase-like phosphatase (HAD superfamily)
MPLSCIVFDCDGIILESVDTKNTAFGRVCDEIAPEHTEAFLEYVALHGGVSQFEKFAWLVERAENRAITEEESRIMGEKFHRYCIEAVLAAPLVPGFLETAKRWLGKVPMYIASGSYRAAQSCPVFRGCPRHAASKGFAFAFLRARRVF